MKIQLFATRPRKINPETEAFDALCQHFVVESYHEWAEQKVPSWPLKPKTASTKWAIDREWIKNACYERGFMRRLASTDAEKNQCTQEEVEIVIMFLVELNEWCRLNKLRLPDDCDPKKWDVLSKEQREAICEGLAANTTVKAFDPFNL